MIAAINKVGVHGNKDAQSLYITIPVEYARKHGITKGDCLELKEQPDGSLKITKAEA